MVVQVPGRGQRLVGAAEDDRFEGDLQAVRVRCWSSAGWLVEAGARSRVKRGVDLGGILPGSSYGTGQVLGGCAYGGATSPSRPVP